jgi:peptide subunit release factor 1 (eRF1)
MLERETRLRCPKCGQTTRVIYTETNVEEWFAEWSEQEQRYEYDTSDCRSSELESRDLPICPDDGELMREVEATTWALVQRP